MNRNFLSTVAFIFVNVSARLAAAYNTASPWPDTNGDGIYEITYSYSNLLGDSPDPHNGEPEGAPLGGNLTDDELRQAIVEAFNLWATYAPLEFIETADSGPPIDNHTGGDDPHSNYAAAGHPLIRIGHHPIDGTPDESNTVAHARTPGSAGLDGDVHFDTAELWTLGNNSGPRVDIVEVAVHEIGHALGLEHEDDTDAIMNSSVGAWFSGLGTGFLFDDDIDGIRDRYGSGRGSVDSISDGTRVWSHAVNGNWQEDSRWSGAQPTSDELARFNRDGDYTVVIDRYTASDGLQVDRGKVTLHSLNDRYDINGLIVLGGDWDDNGSFDPAYLSLTGGEMFVQLDVHIARGSTFNVEESTVKVEGSILDDEGFIQVRRGTLDVGSEITVDGGELEITDNAHVKAQYLTSQWSGDIEVRDSSVVVERDLFFGRDSGFYGSLDVDAGSRIDVLRNATIPIPLTMEVGETSPLIYVEGMTNLVDNLGGRASLTVNFEPGFVPAVNDSFNLFDFGSFTETFAYVLLPFLPQNLRWDQSSLYVNGVLSIEAAPLLLPGDYNNDGAVNAADYTVWRDGGSPDDTIAGYTLWKGNFGENAATGADIDTTSTGVPEPSTTWMLALTTLLAFVVAHQSTPVRSAFGAN